MAKNTGIKVFGVGAAGLVGYYLYTAGGDPKAAQKYAEADASKVSSKLRGELPGKEKEFEKKGEAYASQLGSKVDSAVADAKSKLSEAELKAQQYGKETKADVRSAIDQFDKTVEKKTSEAKSGISSWFGFGK